MRNMATSSLKKPALRKRKSEPSFGIDVVKNKKLLKYKDMQIFANTSFSSEQNISECKVNDTVHMCLVCSEEYETISLLNIHLWDHTPSSKMLGIHNFTCIKCNKNYCVQSCFIQHMKNHHNNNHFCKYCSVSFDSFAIMKHHIKEMHTKDMILRGKEIARFICVFCPAAYYSASLLIPHLRKYHSKQTELERYYPRCVITKTATVTEECKRNGQKNEIISENERTLLKYSAEKDMQVSGSRANVKTPAKIMPKYNCNHCDINFFSSINLQKHQKRCHKIDKIFKPTFGCAKCSAKFFKKTFLKKHLVNHHGTSVTPKV